MTVEPNKQVMAMEIADRMLAEVATVDDAQKLIDMAEMARVYARQSKLGTSAVNHATVIKLRAERKLADIVDEGQRRGEIATPEDTLKTGPVVRTADNGKWSLEQLGIERQRLAEARVIRDAFTESDLAARQQEADNDDEVMSRRALIEEARRLNAVNGAIQTQRVNLLYPVYDALKALATVPVSAREWGNSVPSYATHRVSDHLHEAMQWLSELKESWNK